MFGSGALRAAKARMAGAPRSVLAVLMAVVLTVSLVPSISWADEGADAQQLAVEDPVGSAGQEQNVLDEAPVSEPAEQPEPEAPDEEPAPVVDEDVSVVQDPASADDPVDPAGSLASTAQVQDATQQDEVSKIRASVSFIGVDAQGADQIWAAQKTYLLDEGATADVISEKILIDAGLTADYGVGSWGWSLNTVTSPSDGKVYGWDANTGKYWQLFVNGVCSDLGAGSVVLQDGDVITWYYSAWGASLPSVDLPGTGEGSGSEGEGGEGSDDDGEDPVVDLPDYEAAWPSYANGGISLAAPTGEVQASWIASLKSPDDWMTSVSDPIVVNGDVYIVVGSTILCKDAVTGRTKMEAQLAAGINSTARIVYSGGLIVIPLEKGMLQALAADTLSTVWMTDALPAGSAGDQQPLTTLTVSDGRVYYGTASADWTATYGGYFLCVDLQTGRVVWSYEDVGAGFYWAGAAMSGPFAVIANDNGALRSFNADGSVAAVLDLGVRVRSTVVADGSTVFVVSSDGVLHKISVAADGSMEEVASVSFGSSSTSTPVLADGKVIVVGSSSQSYANSWGGTSYYGVVAVIDAVTMRVEQSITALDDGSNLPADSKSAPLVSVQNGKTYVYFTCNSTPGGVYRYRVGDAAAQEIYVPQADLRNYCMASVIADANGVLYYTNDSGSLFALKGVASDQGASEDDGEEGPSNPSDPSNPSSPPNPQAGGSAADSPAAMQDGSIAAGTVAPGQQPLVKPAESSAADNADLRDGKKAGAYSKGLSPEALIVGAEDASDSASGQGGLNLLALAGVVTGLAGLAAILFFLLKRRQR